MSFNDLCAGVALALLIIMMGKMTQLNAAVRKIEIHLSVIAERPFCGEIQRLEIRRYEENPPKNGAVSDTVSGSGAILP